MNYLVMKRRRFLSAIVGGAFAGVGHLGVAQDMPSDDAINKAMQAAQKRAAGVLGQAEQRAAPSSVVPQRMMPRIDSPRPGESVDPGQIAERYRDLVKKARESDAPELLVFVSLSMPEESLRRIGQQARKAGAVVVLRGTKHGLKKGTWIASINALKPITDTGADVQIHPELFGRYSVTAVPAVVVAASPQAGCQDDACAAKSAVVYGDVSLDYSLEQLSDRRDQIGMIARSRLNRLRNS